MALFFWLIEKSVAITSGIDQSRIYSCAAPISYNGNMMWCRVLRICGLPVACCSPWARKESDTTEHWTEVTGGSVVQNLPASTVGMTAVPGWGGSPGEGHGNPLQYSCLESPEVREAWRTAVHGVAKESDMTERLTLMTEFRGFGHQSVSSYTSSRIPYLPWYMDFKADKNIKFWVWCYRRNSSKSIALSTILLNNTCLWEALVPIITETG